MEPIPNGIAFFVDLLISISILDGKEKQSRFGRKTTGNESLSSVSVLRTQANEKLSFPLVLRPKTVEVVR